MLPDGGAAGFGAQLLICQQEAANLDSGLDGKVNVP